MNEKVLEMIKSSLPYIVENMGKDSLRKFLHTPKEQLYLYHYGLGTWIRSVMLTDNSPLYQAFLEDGVDHRDDMSQLIIDAVYDLLGPNYFKRKGTPENKK